MNDPADRSEPQPAATDLSGRELGDFRLIRRLGRGAMAEVYLAEQLTLKRRVAVKILRPELAGDESYLKRFQREAQAAASLVHANIVQIYEVGQREGLHYIAQEYVQGQNLRDWLARHGPPQPSEAMSIIRQVAAALAKAAEYGVVHRDIKPENIMVTPEGEVKVADFGLARVAQEGSATNLTQAGVTLGTPLYMSPEQVEGKPLDPRSDLYSLGATCYHMLAGSPPFSAETALGVAVQHLKRQPEPLESVRPDLPPGLCRIVHQMLAKAPQARYQSALEVLRDLRRLHEQQFGTAWPGDIPGWESAGTPSALDARHQVSQRLAHLMQALSLQRRGQHGRLLFAAALSAAFLVGAGVAWFTVRQASPLADVQSPRPARRQTALQQYLYASRIGTEEAWKSVVEYFPEKQPLVRRARQQLARIYLRDLDFDRALAIFRELAAEGDSDASLRAFALAGQCGVLTLKGKYRESAALMDQLWPIRSHLRDPQMRKLLDYAVQKNRSQLGPQTAAQWDQWLAEQFGEEG